MKITLPEPRATIPFPSSRVSTNGAVRFTSSTVSQSSSAWSTAAERAIVPALLTRMSTARPPEPSSDANSLHRDTIGEVDAVTGERAAGRLDPLLHLARLGSSCWLTPTMSAPARASASAIANPMPRLQPVTTASFPVRSNIPISSSSPQSMRIFIASPDSRASKAAATLLNGSIRVISAAAGTAPSCRSRIASSKSERS